MTREARPSWLATVIIVVGVGVIAVPAVYWVWFLATGRMVMSLALTAGACVLIPAVFVALVMGFSHFTTRRITRFAMSRCVRCGYDLRGTDGTVCPECGAAQRVS